MKILVPVDFTPKNEAAFTLARVMAQQAGSKIVLIHVIERVEHLPARTLAGFYRTLRNAARTRMRATVARHFGGAGAPRVVICLGRRAEQIVARARKETVDLIVLNSHRIRPKRPGAGWATISYEVALTAPCHVLLVK